MSNFPILHEFVVRDGEGRRCLGGRERAGQSEELQHGLLLARRHCGGVVYSLTRARGWAGADNPLQLCEGQMILNILGLRSWFKPAHGIGYFRAGY